MFYQSQGPCAQLWKHEKSMVFIIILLEAVESRWLIEESAEATKTKAGVI